MPDIENDYTIGVDISKALLDVHLLGDDIGRQFTNDRRGFQELIKWIGKRKIARIVFEPTGAYHRAFEDALSKAGLPRSILYRRAALLKHVAHGPRRTRWTLRFWPSWGLP